MELRRKRIGIIFNFRKGWMGGLIYIVNLVNALNFLADKDKPEIVVIHTHELLGLVKEFRYPYLTLVPHKFVNIYYGYFLSWLKGKNVFYEGFISDHKLDVVYPANDNPVSVSRFGNRTKLIAWIPDLQHKFYPQFFDKIRIYLRELRIRITLRNSLDLVVSSHDVESHFRRFYSIRREMRIHILQFVSINSEPSNNCISEIGSKYKIPNEYYMVSNQFTNHKNHLVVLEALVLLKKKGIIVHFVFTGKMELKQNTKYIKKIRSFVVDNHLGDQVSFLDVIPRGDQLCLMKHAKAIVQPSFFEGWSTVIEDAISLQVPVIASNLDVNIEQLGDKGVFFDPRMPDHLALILSKQTARKNVQIYENYDERIERYAYRLLRVFDGE